MRIVVWGRRRAGEEPKEQNYAMGNLLRSLVASNQVAGWWQGHYISITTAQTPPSPRPAMPMPIRATAAKKEEAAAARALKPPTLKPQPGIRTPVQDTP